MCRSISYAVVLLFNTLLVCSASQAETVEVLLWSQTYKSSLAITWADDQMRSVGTVKASFRPGEKSATIEAPEGASVAEVTETGFWTPGLSAGCATESCDKSIVSARDELRLEIFEAGILEGTLLLPEGEWQDLERVRLEFLPLRGKYPGSRSSESQKAATGTGTGTGTARILASECELAEDNLSYSCPLPVHMRLPIRLVADDWSPALLWDPRIEELDQQEVVEIGPTSISRGAVLYGDIALGRSEAENTEPGELVVKVVPTGLRDGKLVSIQSLEESVEVSRFSVPPEGFFQVSGIPEGRHFLTIGNQKFGDYISQDIEFEDGRKVDLGRIALDPKVEILRIQIEPETPPGHAAWRLRLVPDKPIIHGEMEALASPSGEVLLSEVGAGRYELHLFAGSSRYFQETIEVESNTEILTVGLDTISLQGEVLMAGEGVPADLRFSPVGNGERIAARADEEGLFGLTLPYAGTWKIEVRSRELGWVVLDDPIEVESGNRAVTILLPGGVISGNLEFDDIDPEPASVSLRSNSRALVARVDAAGDNSFRIRAVPDGKYWIRAEAAKGTSAWKQIEVVSSTSPTFVDLVLSTRTQYDLRIIEEGSFVPVPHAKVKIFPRGDKRAPAGTQIETTDVAGTVRFETDARSATIVVESSEHPFFFSELALEGNSTDLSLAIPSGSGGNLVVPSERPSFLPEGETIVEIEIQHREASLSMRELISHAVMGLLPDGTPALKNLAPGFYDFCAHYESGVTCAQVHVTPLTVTYLEFAGENAPR